MSDKIEVPSFIGDMTCDLIKQATGRDAEIILITIPPDGGQPCYVTSLHPDVMETILREIGKHMTGESKGRRVYKDIYVADVPNGKPH